MQQQLFDAGELTSRTELDRRCTPARSGSGPPRETCRICRFKTQWEGVAGRYLKCALMKHEWSRGGATDIRANWPTCSEWKPKTSENERTNDESGRNE